MTRSTSPPVQDRRRRTPTELSARVLQNVRSRREARGWTISDLTDRLAATGCTLTKGALSMRERGLPGRRNDVTVDELYAFARVLGCTADQLVAQDGLCGTCHGTPPPGYRCLTCDTAAATIGVAS